MSALDQLPGDVRDNPPENAVAKGRLAVPTDPGIGAQIELETIAPFRSFDLKAGARKQYVTIGRTQLEACVPSVWRHKRTSFTCQKADI